MSPQLPASSVDIMSFLIAQGAGDAVVNEFAAEAAAVGFLRSFPRESFYRVIGDEVDFCMQTPRDVRQLLGLLRSIVYSGDEDVFQRDDVLGTAAPAVQRRQQFTQWPFAVDGHNSRAHVIRCSVQRNREAYRDAAGCKSCQARHMTGGGDGDMSSPNGEEGGSRDESQGGQEVISIGQRLPHAHEDEVVHSLSHQVFSSEDLADEFGGGEAAPESQQTTGAESATEGTADL